MHLSSYLFLDRLIDRKTDRHNSPFLRFTQQQMLGKTGAYESKYISAEMCETQNRTRASLPVVNAPPNTPLCMFTWAAKSTMCFLCSRVLSRVGVMEVLSCCIAKIWWWWCRGNLSSVGQRLLPFLPLLLKGYKIHSSTTLWGKRTDSGNVVASRRWGWETRKITASTLHNKGETSCEGSK